MNRCLTLPNLCQEKETTIVAASQFGYQIYNATQEVPLAQWTEVVPVENIFFNLEYFSALEAAIGDATEFRYVVISKQDRPVGVAIFQILQFSGSNIADESAVAGKGIAATTKRIFNSILVKFVNKLSICMVVNGNSFVTGEYGLFVKNNTIANHEKKQIIDEAVALITEAEKPKRKVSGTLIKDFYEEEKEHFQSLEEDGFLLFKVNPNMILEIDSEWKNFNDYLAAMTSKYRTRMKKAKQRSATIEVKELSADEIENSLSRISNLYDQVIDKSAFKITKLNIEYLVGLKRNLKEQFNVVGYYLKGDLVGFITDYYDGDELIAGYMGMEQSINKQYDLYLTILLGLAERGILNQSKRVVYGRTSMEIKSSVGARPKDMYLFTKHNSVFINKIMQFLVKRIAENPEWDLRTPFKKDRS